MRKGQPGPVQPDFRRAAWQRLEAGEFLAANGFGLDAIYLTGYAVECALKALILDRAPQSAQAGEMQLFRGQAGHDLERLLQRLGRLGCRMPDHLGPAFRRFHTWSTDLRYQAGERDSVEADRVVKAARQIVEWMRRSVRHA